MGLRSLSPARPVSVYTPAGRHAQARPAPVPDDCLLFWVPICCFPLLPWFRFVFPLAPLLFSYFFFLLLFVSVDSPVLFWASHTHPGPFLNLLGPLTHLYS